MRIASVTQPTEAILSSTEKGGFAAGIRCITWS